MMSLRKVTKTDRDIIQSEDQQDLQNSTESHTTTLTNTK